MLCSVANDDNNTLATSKRQQVSARAASACTLQYQLLRYNKFTMEESTAAILPWIATAVLVVFGSYHFVKTNKSDNKSHNAADDIRPIPWAHNYTPLLGHALEYKKDPSGFLLRASQQSEDGIFQLNLAGKQMIVVCDNDENNNLQRELATLPESVLSAKQAVADIGFEQTLGTLNVYEGTTLHKGIIKGHLVLSGGNGDKDQVVVQWTRAIQQGIQQETIPGKKCEFFHWMRRVMLRTTIDVMIGKAFLQLENQGDGVDDVDFMDTFMQFQDTLEDVTAKAVVLPRIIALNCFLLPLERRRQQLQKVIEKRLEHILQQKPKHGDYSKSINSIGFWLQEALIDDKQYSLADISEFIVGLLFAAHKNPAIGAAQSYLFLRESCEESGNNGLLEVCQKEARDFLQHPSWDCIAWGNSNEQSMLQRVCYESLRVTAHSIGAVRTAKQDIIIGSKERGAKYRIRKGSSVSFSHIVPNLNPTVWGAQAKQVNISIPQQSESTSQYADEYKFTTFSHGVHKCPGQHLAMILLQASLSVLLVDYEVRFSSMIPPLCFERATLAQRSGPVEVVIESKSRQ